MLSIDIERGQLKMITVKNHQTIFKILLFQIKMSSIFSFIISLINIIWWNLKLNLKKKLQALLHISDTISLDNVILIEEIPLISANLEAVYWVLIIIIIIISIDCLFTLTEDYIVYQASSKPNTIHCTVTTLIMKQKICKVGSRHFFYYYIHFGIDKFWYQYLSVHWTT